MELSQVDKALNLDANASFGPLPEVSETLRERFKGVLNPSSIHRGGQAARAIIEEARSELAAVLSLTRNERVIFTSGATESNNMALRVPFAKTSQSASLLTPHDSAELIVSALEHPSVLEPAQRLATLGHSLSILHPSDANLFSPAELVALVGAQTKLISVMYANNETGHIYPIADLATAARAANADTLFHCDAVQALGKIVFRFDELGVDMMSLSAHKIGGLAGTGALIVSERVPQAPMLFGGPQESRWRAGTENVLGILSFGVALRVLHSNQKRRVAQMKASRDRFFKALAAELPDLQLNSSPDGLPNTLNLSFAGVRADDLVVALDMDGILVSSGAACASGKPEPSHVLLALGLTSEQARQSVRISLTGLNSDAELDRAATLVIANVRRMRGVQV